MLLARNSTTTWSLVFDREDAALFVERTVNDMPDGNNRQTVDDFLASVPADSVGKEAVARLTALLTVMSEPAGAIDWRRDPKTAMAWAGFSTYCLALEDDFRRCARMFLSILDEESSR
jgi:hypothetical protein